MSSSRDQRRILLEQLIGSDVAEGRFTVESLLGFGGMGAVYAANQKNMGRSVALKLIPTHDPTTVARFEREALTISKLRHPNTITVFDYGKTEDHFLFLSMELLEGKTLNEAISSGPVSAIDAVHIAAQICRSLSEAHRNGIVHRDVKPDNIILIRVDDDPNVVKVLDFGIAKAVLGEDDVQLTGDGRIVGTPRYMSPEQILAEPVDLRSDIYSLGCIIFEMLCGAPPFQQKSTTALMISHTQDPPPAFAQRLETGVLQRMPSGLERVVRKALAKNPNNRQQSCDELRIELENALSGLMHEDEFEGGPTAIGVDASNPHLSSDVSANLYQQHYPTSTPNTSSQSAEFAKEKSKLPLILLFIAALFGVAIAAWVFLKSEDKPEKIERVEIIPTPDVKAAKDESKKIRMVRFRIETDPSNAKVREKGALLGTTPLEFPVNLTNEKVALEISKKGFETLSAVLFVDPERPNTKKLFKLTASKKVKARTQKDKKLKKRVRKKPVDDKKTNGKKISDKKSPNIKMLDDSQTDVKLLDD